MRGPVQGGEELKQKKFSQSLSDKSFSTLQKIADDYGAISVQELIRNVVIPEWMAWLYKKGSPVNVR